MAAIGPGSFEGILRQIWVDSNDGSRKNGCMANFRVVTIATGQNSMM